MTNFKELFQLDPNIHFLNHGSFGACPKPVFESYQNWQRELESRPVEFLGRRAADLLAEARQELAAYLNCAADEIVYFPNPTTAINMVVNNLQLQPGDEILTTDHEYGAMDRTWHLNVKKNGWKYINHPMPVPLSTPEELVERFWAGVTKKTKVIFISHLTSQTALRFPVEEICRRAREANILSIVDGAHVPGHFPLDLRAVGADVYTGACHKWLCAPKGAAFLYAREEVQDWLNPLIVSWGDEAEQPGASQFIDYHEWQGTRDISSFLSVPAAIEFQAAHNWPAVQANCRKLVQQARNEIHQLTQLPPLCPDGPYWFKQLAAMPLPELDEEELQRTLYNQYQIEIPLYRWQGKPHIRVSVQAYNTEDDIQALVNALKELLP